MGNDLMICEIKGVGFNKKSGWTIMQFTGANNDSISWTEKALVLHAL